MAQSTAVGVSGTGPFVINAGPCSFRGLAISSVAGADVVVYDNASTASGTVIAAFTIGAKGFQPMDVSDGMHCNNGIYMTVSAAVTGNVRIG